MRPELARWRNGGWRHQGTKSAADGEGAGSGGEGSPLLPGPRPPRRPDPRGPALIPAPPTHPRGPWYPVPGLQTRGRRREAGQRPPRGAARGRTRGNAERRAASALPGPRPRPAPAPRPAPTAGPLTFRNGTSACTSERGATSQLSGTSGNRAELRGGRAGVLGSAPHPVPPRRQHRAPGGPLRSSFQQRLCVTVAPSPRCPRIPWGAPRRDPRPPTVPGSAKPSALRGPGGVGATCAPRLAGYLSPRPGAAGVLRRLSAASRYSMPSGAPACGAPRTRGTRTRPAWPLGALHRGRLGCPPEPSPASDLEAPLMPAPADVRRVPRAPRRALIRSH